MNKQKNKKTMLKTETVKILGTSDLDNVAGGGIHGTGTPTGLCPTNTRTCPKLN